MPSNYPTRNGDYLYEVTITRDNRRGPARQYRAHLSKVEHLEAGLLNTRDVGLPAVYGRTVDDAISALNRRFDAWRKEHPQSFAVAGGGEAGGVRGASRVGDGGVGPRGVRGDRGIQTKTINGLVTTIEKLRSDANIQFTRIAQLQSQLDLTLKNLREIAKQVRRGE
jgi:hypothetical protein